MSVIVRTIADGLLERHLVVTKDMKNDVAQKFLSCSMFLFRVLMGKHRMERGRGAMKIINKKIPHDERYRIASTAVHASRWR